MENAAGRDSKSAFGKALKVFGVFFTLLLVGCLCLALISRQSYAKAIEAELAKAKAAGIPISVEDIERYVGPPPLEKENSASLYMELTKLKRQEAAVPTRLRTSLLANPTEKDIKEAKELLSQNVELLRIAVEAGKRPKFQFDHDWSKGFFAPVHYYGPASGAASLLALRALISKIENRDAEALADLKTVRMMADHMRQDTTSLSESVSIIMVIMISPILAEFAASEPPGSVWIKELEELEKSIKVPTLQEMVVFDLFMDLLNFESIKTPEQRKKALGNDFNSKTDFMTRITSAAMPPETGLLPALKSRIDIWNELAKGDAVDWTRIAKFDEQLKSGYSSNPYMRVLMDGLSGFDTKIIDSPRKNVLERKLLIQGAVRVLKQRDRTIMPDFSDLISPTDGLPIRGAVVGDSVILASVDSPSSAMMRRIISFKVKR